jgi:hypothetical protein
MKNGRADPRATGLAHGGNTSSSSRNEADLGGYSPHGSSPKGTGCGWGTCRALAMEAYESAINPGEGSTAAL